MLSRSHEGAVQTGPHVTHERENSMQKRVEGRTVGVQGNRGEWVREAGSVLVTFCWVTNYSRTKIHCLAVSEGQEPGGRLAGWLWLWVSHEVAVKAMARAVGI